MYLPNLQRFEKGNVRSHKVNMTFVSYFAPKTRISFFFFIILCRETHFAALVRYCKPYSNAVSSGCRYDRLIEFLFFLIREVEAREGLHNFLVFSFENNKVVTFDGHLNKEFTFLSLMLQEVNSVGDFVEMPQSDLRMYLKE